MTLIDGVKVDTRPYYVPVGDEVRVFKAAYRQGLSILLKGPTGCGKTRFVEAMADVVEQEIVRTDSDHRADKRIV
jgi:nitric oxide reductase NorQ protein